MMDEQNRIRALREAGRVSRCHNLPHHGTYDIAHHSWQAVMLLYCLHPNPSQSLVWAVMFHDVGERFYGDLPAPAGWADRPLKEAHERVELDALKRLGVFHELTDAEVAWAHAVDRLELLLWCEDQLALGNRHVTNCYDAVRNWFRTTWNQQPSQVQDYISNYEWKRGNEQL